MRPSPLQIGADRHFADVESPLPDHGAEELYTGLWTSLKSKRGLRGDRRALQGVVVRRSAPVPTQ